MDFLLFAHQLADKAGELSRAAFRTPSSYSLKNNGSLVTATDKLIERTLRKMIEDTFPEHGILGEEYGVKENRSAYQWIIDPIDGTSSFAAGKPTFCTLIALMHHHEVILGLIDQPILKDRWVGMKNEHTRWNGVICTASNAHDGLCRFNCTSADMFKTDKERAMFDRIKRASSSVTYGGDAYAYGLLAGGHIDVILESDLKCYDVAAMIPIIQGMGGIITDWQGKPLSMHDFQGKVFAARSQDYWAKLVTVHRY